MSTNPLYPIPTPAPQAHRPTGDHNPAADLIRQKLAGIYSEEPNASQELAQSQQPTRSPHQQFMQQLSASGKSLAEIQTAWHHYYANLPDDQKHSVWQEFYGQSQSTQQRSQPPVTQRVQDTPRQPAVIDPTPPNTAYGDDIPASAIRAGLRDTVSHRAKLKPRHHLQSLLFGLGCGGLALLLVLFSFFNEMFVAPFIQPSRTVNATPIIIGADGIAPSDKAEVIIPKINVQIPLDFSAPSIKEDDIQKSLEKGVVHYPTTVMPGQQGNTTFFGHSSNNIFNPGDYKFAFVLLHELIPGDTFYLTRDGIAYSYQVIDKKIVEPTEVSILDPVPGKTATATLITCDPPGTTLRRLAVIGEQVSPSPSANTPGTPPPVARDGSQQATRELPGPAPSFWHRLTSWFRD